MHEGIRMIARIVATIGSFALALTTNGTASLAADAPATFPPGRPSFTLLDDRTIDARLSRDRPRGRESFRARSVRVRVDGLQRTREFGDRGLESFDRSTRHIVGV